jgi:hypothetical protein
VKAGAAGASSGATAAAIFVVTAVSETVATGLLAVSPALLWTCATDFADLTGAAAVCVAPTIVGAS